MSWIADHAWHLVLLLAYLAVLARHAWVGRRHVHTLDDYLVAGRRLGGLVIALSFYATFMSTNTFVGAKGLFGIADPVLAIAFHPNATQFTLHLGDPGGFSSLIVPGMSEFVLLREIDSA